MLELIVIKALLGRALFLRYYSSVSVANPDLKKIYYTLRYLTNEGDSTLQELELCFYTQYPFLKSGEREVFEAIFKRMESMVVDEEKIEEYFKKQLESTQARHLAELALDVSEGRKEFNEIHTYLEKVDNVPILEETEFVCENLTELYRDQVATNGLRWRMACLNNSLGSLRKGDFGFLFARPETGKTTFLASEISYMATQASSPVIWFNNEEQHRKVMLRCIQAALGLTLPQLYSNLPHYENEYNKLIKGRIKIPNLDVLNKHEIEKICKNNEPSLIIFDQIDKIKGFKADRKDLELGEIYQWARELAKKYAPVIAVCQADGTGEGQKWLNMGHVADAKTSKQGEADWILGIGKVHDQEYEFTRYLNISKNKLLGDEDTNPAKRHARMQVLIRPDVARYQNV